MLYLSKGIIRKHTNSTISVIRGEQTIILNNSKADLWSKGKFGFAVTDSKSDIDELLGMENMGLVECESENNTVSQYFILTRCVFCASDEKILKLSLSKLEKDIMTWIEKAGIRLSVAEIIYLIENKIKPTKDLFYEENRQALVEQIYTIDNIADNILENQMQEATCRDEVVNALISLLRKRYLMVL